MDVERLKRIEAGEYEPTVRNLANIARALGMEPGALVEGLDRQLSQQTGHHQGEQR